MDERTKSEKDLSRIPLPLKINLKSQIANSNDQEKKLSIKRKKNSKLNMNHQMTTSLIDESN